MSNNTIQIKRSTATAAPATLNAGELAYSNVTQVLYIGDPGTSAVTPIAGVRNPGVLTANQALVANSTSGIDKVNAGIVNTSTITVGNNTVYSYSNSTLFELSDPVNFTTITTNSVSVSNTLSALNTLVGQGYVTATSGAQSATFQYNGLHIGNSTVNVSINSTSITGITTIGFGNTTVNVVINSISGDWFSTTSNTSINASSIWIGNNTLGTATANTLYFNANSSSIWIGNTSDNIIINANTVQGMEYLTIGNNSVYSYTNSTAIVLSDAFNNTTITTSSIFVNGGALNTLIGEGYVTAISGSQFANLQYFGLQVGANVGVYQAGVSVGNSTTNSNLTYNSLVVGNATNYSTVNTTTVNTGTIITTTGATLGGTTTTVSSNLNVTSANFSAVNITVSGNLSVTGTVTTINSQQLIVNDNIIELADGNLTTDIIDTGIYSAAGNSTNSWYSGYVRQAAKSTKLAPYFWFFGSNTSPNTSSTIDTSSNSWTGYIQSYLVPYGTGGAFVANATVVNITANSTVSSALVANSLTLTTALSAASGGTGILGSVYAAGDMIYAANSSPASLSRLSVPGTVANGQVLQIINNLPAYGVLDGGTF